MNAVHSPATRTGLVLMAAAVAVAGSLAAATISPRPRVVITSSSIWTVPDGYRYMSLGKVTPLPNGEYAVDLVDANRAITLYVGSSEGWAITLRSEGRKFVRPLTVDLLDATMQQLGGELDRIQVDKILDGAYHGSLHLHRGAEHFTVDARPSDAIALAIGNQVPILVADAVIAEAGHPRDQ
jgi:bifunctional DNase/RNase